MWEGLFLWSYNLITLVKIKIPEQLPDLLSSILTFSGNQEVIKGKLHVVEYRLAE